MSERIYLAVDLGAESGRVVAGRYVDGKLSLEEVHRFLNGPVTIMGSRHWRILELFFQILEGLKQAAETYGDRIVSIGVDTWGVDYGYIDAAGKLLGLPYHYRDARTDTMQDEAFKRIDKREIYDGTGIQFLPFNTMYQMLSDVMVESTAMKAADGMLFIPDLLSYWLTGEKKIEYTIASTSQLMDMRTGDWNKQLLNKLGIDDSLFGEVVQPGDKIGMLHKTVQDQTGLGNVPVVAVGSHDTASAVAAVPAANRNFAYLSSGTWSLMGVEVAHAVVNEISYEHSLTNEGGVFGTIRLLKNIAGLYLAQECRRDWLRSGEEFSYPELWKMADEAEPFATILNPDDPGFFHPGNMPDRIAGYCRREGKKVPESKGAFIRAVLESLALKYRQVLQWIQEASGQQVDCLHIVGGGSQNTVLNQFTADSLNIPVVAGPVEATGAGNILVQMVAAGDMNDLSAGRAMIRNSFEMNRYEPKNYDEWNVIYKKEYGA